MTRGFIRRQKLSGVYHEPPHPDAAKCAVQELTRAVNLIPGGLRLNAHEVGRALTVLGITGRTRSNSGYIVWLDLPTRRLVHKLAREYGLDQEPLFTGKGFSADCPICEELTDANRSSAELKRDAGTNSRFS
jgi:hypothetical protein